ncbi:hypothetical protein L249_7352 [Ophiocordyceps polyrhachis-furcata BCC 54312]|uniref:Uncharacterized protein n=1 Tax=Ophiocordyceps polyrhachis-furcata BCC 54312 TaxID=1330021 RepID=A0A367LB75_9HYPO|nr:hypothetical protein L249_7352 [Ophiocordyceps polyrhachis-furcata BCC 54312]
MDRPWEPCRPVAGPSPTASTTEVVGGHLARFEFSDDGTKVLMVESPALDPVSASPAAYCWRVTWPGKSPTTALPAPDDESRRLYFLLSPDAPIPPTVTIESPGRPNIAVKSLPAIFPTGFDAEVGVRGVLHTLWAKKRLLELQREMETELTTNAEGVGLEMVLAERQWIMDTFLCPSASLPPKPRSSPKNLRLATSSTAISSLAGVLCGPGHEQPNTTGPQDDEDGLFALPMSPRSPEERSGPYSAL